MKAPSSDWQAFVLRPFESEDARRGQLTSTPFAAVAAATTAPAAAGAGLELSGEIRRRGGTLELRLCLGGDLASLLLVEPCQRPERRDDLWRSTCFELFLASEGQPFYWEVNLSAAGHWNVYRFSGYRQGMAIEPSLQALPFELKSASGGLELALNWPLPEEIRSTSSALVAGVCAVIEQRQGLLSHWAVTHPGSVADFHRRDGLVLRL
ncbi:DOMON-like domain-containing protein [Synechococcus sp. CS-1329]|uniref:DOMON-like domain-containing protein n=1 Tax=Synechococcus sp. CS-1329 TaxID=2847975 RepID=UPI00223A82B5|nr:DOMON-like domain-containing protein [Synechococcus sp. CS-1329]MCT0219969.1 DOMON-like domain-containing protein [Synechococcus sp. CS-1329]